MEGKGKGWNFCTLGIMIIISGIGNCFPLRFRSRHRGLIWFSMTESD